MVRSWFVQHHAAAAVQRSLKEELHACMFACTYGSICVYYSSVSICIYQLAMRDF